MAVLTFRTNTYARNIYLYGSTSGTRLTNIPAEYVEPVKKAAAATFSVEQIDNTLSQEWITQTEYDETMAIKYPVAQ
jgi:hypothetical protein